MKRFTFLISLVSFTLIFSMSSCGDNSSSSNPKTSSGYMDEKDYTPTVSDKGEYHTIDGSAKQLQYQGSEEQKNDLEAIDAYYSEHPEDW